MTSSDEARADADLAAALDGALEREELFAVFQPQFDLRSRDVVGAEALCRWRHPTLGLVPPDVFIPIAERSGAIHPIGRFMLEQALDAASGWQGSTDPVSVSVNASPVQLEADSFVLDVTSMLGRFAFPPALLTIEITESYPLLDVGAVTARLDDIREMGGVVSLDDYGVGHASSTQLARLPVDEVKLDRSLLDGNNLEASDIIAGVVEVARRRGLRVVAEGVETPEQLEFVSTVGCHRAQGFLLGRPVDKDAIDDLILRPAS
ncbi:EAL domain-containing protein [Microbacterium atlanticum]|uniref:EAL domain-containing protein n=1 Tax=Microbacterium atlanticum TaxID=2782168 RepID=UPI001888F417|nr:EAL domain-containing protein [Microbacterium atlanticum]